MELQERHHSGVEDRRYFPAQLGCPQILSPTTGAVACGVVCDLNYPVVVGCEDGSPGKRRNQPVGRRRLHVLECTDDGLVDLVTLDLVKGRKPPCEELSKFFAGRPPRVSSSARP